MARGSVYVLRRRCGKASCRCAKGRPHESTVLSASVSGSTRLWSLSDEQIERLRVLTLRYRRFRSARADLAKLHARMIRLIDRIEKLRRINP